MTTVLVVEDNRNLALGIRTALEREGYSVIESHDGPTGLELSRTERPDLVVLDLMLPGFSGHRVLTTLRGEGLDMPVLILTALGEEDDKVQGLELGADDYMTKPFGTRELAARVAALLRRTRIATSSTIVVGDAVVDLEARTVSRGGVGVPLTVKEYDLLLALVRRGGRVASRQALLREVWGHTAAVLTRTVDVHIAELRRKLEENPARPRTILTVRSIGYRVDVGAGS